MKKWIEEKIKNTEEILARMGLSSLSELAGRFLLIHVSYGGKAKGGQSVLVKIKRVDLYGDNLYFNFESSSIKISFDAVPKECLGGAFKGFDCDEEIEIDGVSCDGTHWTGIFWVNDMQGELHEQNLDVQIIKPT